MNKKRSFSVLYMFVVTLFFTSAVGGVQMYNEHRIELNQQVRLQKIVLEVLDIPLPPGASNARVEEIFQARVQERTDEKRTVYVGLEEDGKQVRGYAFPLQGPGFWGPIHGMMAVDPRLKEVLGIAFYEHSETPGLGGRITEDWFQKQFEGRKLVSVEKGERYFYLRAPGTADEANEVDAISGASETCRRLEVFLDENLKDYLAWLEEKRKDGTLPSRSA